jgi:hypothetical protein
MDMNDLAGRFGLPSGPLAPAAARRAIASVLYAWGLRDPAWMRQTQLIVSELVTNAVLHAGGCLSVELRVAHGRVTIAAVDASTVNPHPHSGGEIGKLGLRIIDELSADWGVDGRPGGKRVWVQLMPHPEAIAIVP